MHQGIFFHVASSRIFSFFNPNRWSSHIMTFSELQIKRWVGLIAALFSFCILLTAEYLVWHLVFEPGLNNLSLCVWRSMRQMHARWLMWNSQRQRELCPFTYRELWGWTSFLWECWFVEIFCYLFGSFGCLIRWPHLPPQVRQEIYFDFRKVHLFGSKGTF